MGKLLVATTLYPNQVQFRHGIFVEARLRRLLAASDHRATVIAPVPWFPFTSQRFTRYVEYARVPHVEQRHGIDIYHPRYLVVPKIGMLLTPLFLAWAMWRQLRAIELGRPVNDDAMVELLEPMRPHRYRVVRLLEVSGLARLPRRGPRLPRHRISGL